MYSIKDYDYHLPEALVAQCPAGERDQSRLMVLDRRTGSLAHHQFFQIDRFLQPGDVVVINNTAVIPARLYGRKPTGGRVELLILDFARDRRHASAGYFECRCMAKSAKPLRSGTRLFFDDALTAVVLDGQHGMYTIRFEHEGDFETHLERIGHIPLPPYIKRNHLPAACDDKTAYQTVYAAHNGAVAAPTAGLHFTEAVMAKLRDLGAHIVAITLHVGYGTFVPVRASDIRNHRMHAEWFEVPEAAAVAINQAKKAGCRVLAVGTTAVRTLEHCCDAHHRVVAGSGDCNLYIYPGYRFKVVDAMLTNFHLPQSTLLMLVSAFAQREHILHAYDVAIQKQYRFCSYGDAMLIL